MKRFTVFLLAICLTAAMLSGCARPAAGEDVYAVSVTPESVTLKPGESARLTAAVTKNGSPVEIGVNWTSADENVAKATDGTVTAVGIGQTTVYAEYQGESAACSVNVREVLDPVANLTLDRSAAQLFVGGSLLLGAVVRKGADVVDTQISWTAAPAGVVSVEGGRVTALAVGDAAVTASATYEGETLSAACDVTVTEKIEVGFTVPEVKLLVGRAIAAPVEVSENDVPAPDAQVELSSDDPSIVTVTEGKLLGRKSGATTVTATYKGKSVTCPLAVYDRTVSTYDEFNATRDHLDEWNLLIADIDAADKTFAPWNAWGNRTGFTGVFDGNGHTVSDLTVTASTNNALAVGIAAGGVLKNVAFTGMKHSHDNHSTGLIMQNYGTIENIYVENELYYTSSVTSSDTQLAGAIAAQNGGTVRNCVAVLTHRGADLNAKAGVAVGRNFDSANGKLERVFGVDGTASGRALVASTKYPGSVTDSAAADSAASLIEENRALMGALSQGVWDVSGLDDGQLPTLIEQSFDAGRPVVVPASLTLAGQYKTQFTVGEDFSYDGLTVTLVNSDGSSALLAQDAYTVTCEAFDKNAPAVYTVSVVYTAVPSIAATYTVTVAAPSTDQYELSVPAGQVVFADPALAGIDVGRTLSYTLTKDGADASADATATLWEDVTGSVENKAGVTFTGDKATGTRWGNATVKLTVTTAAGSVSATADVKVYVPITAGILNKTEGAVEANKTQPASRLQGVIRKNYDVTKKSYFGWYLLLEDLDFAQIGNKNRTVYTTTCIGFVGSTLAADPDMANSRFCGVFDGNGYAVKNVIIQNTTNIGLFAVGKGGVVRNLTVTGMTFQTRTGNTSVRAFVAMNAGTVENVRLEVNAAGYGTSLAPSASNKYGGSGLLVGRNESGGLISKCLVVDSTDTTNLAATDNFDNLAAIAGGVHATTKLTQCFAVSAFRPVGFVYSTTALLDADAYTANGSTAYRAATQAALLELASFQAAVWGQEWTVAPGALPALKSGSTSNATITEAT